MHEAMAQFVAGDARAGAAGGDQEFRRRPRSTTSRSSGSRTTPSIATARDQVRTNLWYTFRRHNIEIPYPIQVQYERTEEPIRTERHVAAAADRLAAIGLFQPLSAEARQALATAASHHLFAAGEAIVQAGRGRRFDVRVAERLRACRARAVRPGSGGHSARRFLWRDVDADRRSPQRHGQGDGRRLLLEIAAKDFRELVQSNPDLLDHVSTIMSTRRTGLEDAKATAAAVVVPEAKENFLARDATLPHSAQIMQPPFPLAPRAGFKRSRRRSSRARASRCP